MATMLEVYLVLIDELETVLGCAVSKGFPAWARNQVAVTDLPLGALQMARLGIIGPTRVGAGREIKSVAWSTWVFAQDEVQLADLIDNFLAWLKQHPAIVVNAGRVGLALESADRHNSETGVQQEEHGFALTLITQW